MSALSTYSGTTELTEIVPTEDIKDFISEYNYPMPVAMSLAWGVPGTGSMAVRFPRWNAISVPAGTKSQTDVFTDVNIDMAEGSVTPGIVGFRLPVSDEVAAMAVGGVPAGILVEGIRALANRIDSDLCGVSTGSTNQTGAITDEFTLTKFRSALAAYRALEVPDSPLGHALVLDHGPAADLLESLSSSASMKLAMDASSISLGPVSGFIGSLYGVNIFEDLNVAAESTGRSNFLTPIGAQHSGLGIAMSEAPNVRLSRGDDAELRATSYYVFRAWYGVGIVNQTNYLEVLSLA